MWPCCVPGVTRIAPLLLMQAEDVGGTRLPSAARCRVPGTSVEGGGVGGWGAGGGSHARSALPRLPGCTPPSQRRGWEGCDQTRNRAGSPRGLPPAPRGQHAALTRGPGDHRVTRSSHAANPWRRVGSKAAEGSREITAASP